MGGKQGKEFMHFYEVKFQRTISESVRQLETTQMSINTKTEKQIMLYPHNGIISNNKKQTTDTDHISTATWKNLKNTM